MFLKTATVVVATLICHSVLTVYHGFTSDNCSGEETRFESWANLSESDPPIRSYKWSSDEKTIDYGDCELVLTMENLTVTGYSDPAESLSLDEILYDPPDWFFKAANWSSEWNWSVRYAEAKIEELEQCLRSKIDGVLSDEESSSLLSEELRKTLVQIEESKYDLVVGDPMGMEIGGFYSYYPPTIHIDVLEIVVVARNENWSPTAYVVQIILHEMIHAGRRQKDSALENSNEEEAAVWDLTYDIYKNIFGDKEPPNSEEEATENADYDRVQHKLTDDDLCR